MGIRVADIWKNLRIRYMEMSRRMGIADELSGIMAGRKRGSEGTV